jgi:hypothetical protein
VVRSPEPQKRSKHAAARGHYVDASYRDIMSLVLSLSSLVAVAFDRGLTVTTRSQAGRGGTNAWLLSASWRQLRR